MTVNAPNPTEQSGRPAAAPAPVEKKMSPLAVLWDLANTVDHKKIGLMYIVLSIIGLAVGGLLAVAIRVQLALPDQTLLVGNIYNQVLTMHAAVMLFFFLIPIGLFGFGNYFLPLQLGVRDVALPRMNNFAVWSFFFSLVLALLAFVGGGYPTVGWTFYYPLTLDGNQRVSPSS